MDSLYDYRAPLAEEFPNPIDESGEALTYRVMSVLMDALREDISLDPAVMPHCVEMLLWLLWHSQTLFYSAPGWATVLSGA